MSWKCPEVQTHSGGSACQCLAPPETASQSCTLDQAFAPEKKANTNMSIASQKSSGWPGSKFLDLVLGKSVYPRAKLIGPRPYSARRALP